MFRTNFKRRLALCLAVLMIFMSLPMSVSAEVIDEQSLLLASEASELTELGAFIGGEFVKAEIEVPNTDPNIGTFSLLPLQEVNWTLDLTGFTPDELREVELFTVLANAYTITAGSAVVWASTSWEGDFRILTPNEKLDFSGYAYENTGQYDNRSFTLQLIIGSAKQLDPTNTRHIVNVFFTPVPNLNGLVGSFHTPDVDGILRQFTATSSYNFENNIRNFIIYLPTMYPLDSSYHATLSILSGNQLWDNGSTRRIEVYKGYFDTYDEVTTALNNGTTQDITPSLFNLSQGNSAPTATGYLENFMNPQPFTFVMKNGSKVAYMEKINIRALPDHDYVMMHNIVYQDPVFYWRTEAGYISNYVYDNDIAVITYTINQYDPADTELYYGFSFFDGVIGMPDSSKVTKAVVGHYNTLQEAASQNDIKDQLMIDYDYIYYKKDTGYKANYSGDGVDFTIFAAGQVYKYTIKAVKFENQTFEYLNVFGANNAAGSSLSCYTIREENDEYARKGFYTLLISDSTANLTQIAPIFASSGNVTVNGVLQESGITTQDFSKGSVKYTITSTDGSTSQDYWVSFAKKATGGAMLFVNSSDKREVVVSKGYDKYHDIFIANIGDEKLEDLSVVLSNAQNVAIDSYWTVGGEKNTSLAPFTTTELTTVYGELANVAKIRLVAADAITGDGSISGTLTISANGQAPRVITLTGTADMIRFNTQQNGIPNAVRGSSYSFALKTNYDLLANGVRYELVNYPQDYGYALPQGLTLNPNGTISGTPTQTGTYRFVVRAVYSDSYYSTGSTAMEFTMVVGNAPTSPSNPGGSYTPEPPNYNSPQNTTPQNPSTPTNTNTNNDTNANTVEVMVNGNIMHAVLQEDGTVLFRASAQKIANDILQGNLIQYVMEVRGNDKVHIELPISALGQCNYVAITDFGTVNIPNATLNMMSRRFGDTLRLSITRGSLQFALLNKDGKEIPYSSTKDPFTFSMPFTLVEGEKPEAVVAVKINKDDNVILPVSLYADGEIHFSASSTGHYDVAYIDTNFNDTKEHWAEESISFVAARNLFVGTGEGCFTPGGTMTRSMFISVLSRLDLANLDNYKTSHFLDVPQGAWYMAAIEWASAKGIIQNAANTIIEPNTALTREEMAILFYNYIRYKGYSLKEINELKEFSDSSLLSEEGAKAVEMMQIAGVISGKSDNLFDPFGIATRAEVSMMFTKFVEALSR